MLTFFKKDLLIVWRDRREMALAIFLPIVLVVVLNFSFSNVFGTGSQSISLSLAIVNEDDQAAGLEQFAAHVAALDLPAEAAGQLLAMSSQLAPLTLLDQFLQSPDLADWLTVNALQESEARQQLEKEQIDGLLHIPAGYTFQTLNAVLLGEPSAAPLRYIMQENTLNASILGDIMADFFDQLNFQLALQHAIGEALPQQAAPLLQGGREIVAGSEPFTMGQYFTIGMAVLFPLFLAMTIAGKTAAEKRELVFNRIMIANTRSSTYLMGKIWSTFCLVFLQFMFIILVAQAMLGVFAGKSSVFWGGLLLVALFYALFIACLSVIYTSLILVMDNYNTANGIFLLITMMFGVVGGSFVPLYVFPEWLQGLSEWTPNGFTLAALTEWIQFEQFSALTPVFIVLSIAALASLLVGMTLFPKRGEL